MPRSPNEPIFNKGLLAHVLTTGTAMGILSFLVYEFLMARNVELYDARNLMLMLMILFGNIHALNSRSSTKSIFKMPLWSNKFLMISIPLAQLVHVLACYSPTLSRVLELKPVTLKQWALLLVVSLMLIIIEEISKLLKRRRDEKEPLSSRASEFKLES